MEDQRPPGIGASILKIIYGEDIVDEIYGDLIEIYQHRVAHSGLFLARLYFFWDLILSFRNLGLRKRSKVSPSFHTIMLQNHLKIAFRFIGKNKVYAALNIIGLAVGLIATLFIFAYVRFEKSYEDFHQNANRIVRVSVDVYNEGSLNVQDAMSYPAVGPEMKEKYPTVEEYVHFYPAGVIEVSLQQEVYKVREVYFTEGSCFEVFDFDFLYGKPNEVLHKPFEVVITESLARQFFGRLSNDILGQDVKIGKRVKLKVVGIVKDLPLNTHLKAKMLISYATGVSLFKWDVTAWNMNNEYTYLLLNSPRSYDQFLNHLDSYNQELLAKEALFQEEIVAQKLEDIHLYSNKTYEIEPNGEARSVYFMGVIGIFILILACINYVNLFLAKSLERAKEVGIRKVIGSRRKELIGQFLIETFLINVFAALIAILGFELLLPRFYALSGIPESVSFYRLPDFWLAFGILLFTSILFSGLYPSIVLSKLKPITILKGKFVRSQKGIVFRHGLVVFQFAISIMLTIGAFVVGKQLYHLQKTDLGMEIEQIMVVEAPFTDSLQHNFEGFKGDLLGLPGIEKVSRSSSVPGILDQSTTTGIRLKGSPKENNFTYNIYQIDDEFVDLMGIEIIAGENFRPGDEKSYEILVNEETLRLWEINPEEAVGKIAPFWGVEWKIQGVMKNFYQRSPKDPHIAMVLLSPRGDKSWEYASIKINTRDMDQSLVQVEEYWEKHFAGSVFQFHFLDEMFEQQYRKDKSFSDLFNTATMLAILIACLGLLGISSYSAQQRTKEVGIRKTLGASIGSIIGLLLKSYMGLILLAILIAIPVSWLGIREWLQNFATRVALDPWVFLLPVLAVILFALMTVSWHTFSLARTNPVNILKEE